MLPLWNMLFTAIIMPLSILNSRIDAYHNKLSHANLTLSERALLSNELSTHLMQRYELIECMGHDCSLDW